MSKLYNYYGMEINLLCKAVIDSNEQQIDKLLADESFDEINDGVSPLYFIDHIGNGKLDNAKRDKILRIFRKILNNERFTNVNTIFYHGNSSSTLLYHLLFQPDFVFETCCVELINSPKYQLIDYPGNCGNNSSDLVIAVQKEKKLAAKAIMDHPDFTKIDFGFVGSYFLNKCKKLNKFKFLMDEEARQALQLIMDEYVLRDYNMCYNATDTNIAERLTKAIQILSLYIDIPKIYHLSPMSAANKVTRKNNDMIFEIVNHPKFTGEMLSRHICDLGRSLTDKEAYDIFHQNKKLEGWSTEFYGYLAYFLINIGKVGLLKVLLENDNICLSEQFYSFYNYYLKNAIKFSLSRMCVLDYRGYYEFERNEIYRLIDEKYAKQLVRQQLDLSKFVELKKEDYLILRNGMGTYYDLVFKNGNEPSGQYEVNEALRNTLIYDKQKDIVGPFFNLYDRDIVWKLFSEYQSFDGIRQKLTNNIKK